MFLRSILYPSLVACFIGAPMLYSTGWKRQSQSQFETVGYRMPGSDNSFGNGVLVPERPMNSMPLTTASNGAFKAVHSSGQVSLESNAAAPGQPTMFANHDFPNSTAPAIVVAQPATHPVGLQVPEPSTVPGMIVSGPIVAGSATTNPAMFGMTPDYGAAETFVFPGDANGPDLSAKPTDFVPVTNLAEIIRFDVYPNWVKSRWKRVSTNPGDAGLHGLRVAVVTGTNTWDLHGSLTYYFDVNQRAQRITFQGWTGDSSRLVSLLTSQFGLQAQPTHWAGAYAAQNSRRVPTAGLLMQHPAVITRENPVQQVALMMELNHPQGSFSLSEQFVNMLRHAVTAR
jgi:hypothetical protein